VRQGNRTPQFEPRIDEVIDVGHLIADLSAQVLPPSPKNCARQPTDPARYGVGLHWSLEAIKQRGLRTVTTPSSFRCPHKNAGVCTKTPMGRVDYCTSRRRPTLVAQPSASLVKAAMLGNSRINMGSTRLLSRPTAIAIAWSYARGSIPVLGVSH
jgi:hypothetical protein